MAKVLYGAAKIAHQRKMARSSTAIARRTTSSPVRYRTRTKTVVRYRSRKGRVTRRRRRRSSMGFSGGGFINRMIRSLKVQAKQLVAAGVYGFATRGDGATAAGIRVYLDKVPTWDKIGKPASHGLIAQAIAESTGGVIREVAALGAHAALMRSADNFGASGGDADTWALMSGEDDDDGDLSGTIDDDDVGYDDDDDDDQVGEEAADDDDDPGESAE